MKISTKGRYATKLMLDLATYNTGSPVSLKDVAKRQDISEKYLEQIISSLSKAGMVRSVRGAQGGYLLTKEPKEYTVGEILEVTEGKIATVDCLRDDGYSCDAKNQCVTIRIWEKINDAVKDVVDNITLQDLLDWQAEGADQYVI
ncbi:MAG: Rrf2 family transcriptional regulator [Lachnospiraceae bacterium]|nr:Rrf2 family transcriptional regulator [Lachnospiraceae bacterium]